MVGFQYCNRSLSLFSTSELPPFSLSTGECPTPVLPPHSSLKEGELADAYAVGTVLQLQCIPGYVNISGTIPTMACLDTNKWSDLLTLCQGEYLLSTIEAVMK